MSHKKRRLDKATETEPATKKRKVNDNPYLNTADNNDNDSNNEWWKGGNNSNNTLDKEEQNKNDLIDYFANIDYMITNESFDNNETEQMFINNIIKEMQRFEDIIFIFEHPDISKVIEKIIQIFPSQNIRQFIQKFVLPNVLELITKKCSSHVLQTLFALIPRILIEEQSDNNNNNNSTFKFNDDSEKENENENEISSMSDLLIAIINKLQSFDNNNNGLSQLLVDERSTFVIRDLLWICSGVVRFNKTAKKHRMQLHNVRKIPTLQKFSVDHLPLSVVQFSTIIASDLLKYSENKYRLSTHIKQHKYARDKHSNILCGSLGVLIECLFIIKSNDILQQLIDDILKPPPAKQKNNNNKNESEKDRIKKHILEMIINESSSHLIQNMFEFGNKNVSLNIVKKYLNAKDIRDMSLDMNGNYVLQSMLRRLFDIKSIQFIASSVQHNITQLFDTNKIGVLYCLINAFTRANLKPNAMVKTIVNQIKSTQNNINGENENIIYKFLYLNLNENKTKQNLIKSKIMPLSSKYSVLGCLLLQSIIKCNANVSVSIYKSFLLLNKNEIINICRDSSGSHCIQSFIECKYIFDEIKWQLLSKIRDKFHVLCTDKFGNYIMESTFFALSFAYKKQFALALLNCASVLKGSKIGFMLYVKMKLDLLKRDENKWKENIMKQRKHQKYYNHKTKSISDKKDNGKSTKKPKQRQKQKRQTHKNNNKNKVKYKHNKNSTNIKNKYKGRKMKKSNKLF